MMRLSRWSPEIESLRLQLLRLRAQHEQGLLATAAYTQARESLEQALLAEALKQPAAAARRPSPAWWAGVALAVIGLGLAGYASTGSTGRGLDHPAGVAPAPTVESRSPVASEEDKRTADDPRVAEVVNRMSQRLKENPDSPAGWALLARAHTSMGHPGLAVPAFQKALALAGDDADLLADYANALAGRENGRFGPEASAVIERALAREPGNLKAMALAGSVAFDRRDYAGAVRLWDEVAQRLPADSGMLTELRASSVRARELGSLPSALPWPRSNDGTPLRR